MGSFFGFAFWLFFLFFGLVYVWFFVFVCFFSLVGTFPLIVFCVASRLLLLLLEFLLLFVLLAVFFAFWGWSKFVGVSWCSVVAFASAFMGLAALKWNAVEEDLLSKLLTAFRFFRTGIYPPTQS